MRFLILTVAGVVGFAFSFTGLADPLESDVGVTGLVALEQFAKASRLTPGEKVMGLAGFYGDSQPVKWLMISANAATPGILHESVLSGGAVIAEREFRKLVDQDLPDIPLDRETILIDSDEAFDVVAKVAQSEQSQYRYAHFQLRVRDKNSEPIWMISLINKAQVPLGTLYVSAKTGEIVRRAWINKKPPRKPEFDESISQR